jgi:hypothetical protein
MLQPYNLEPPPEWRAFATAAGGERPESEAYKFELGECDVLGPSGQVIRVDTLEYAMQQLDPTAAPGISGLGFDLLKFSLQLTDSLLQICKFLYFFLMMGFERRGLSHRFGRSDNIAG